jgi:hypothetical protein
MLLETVCKNLRGVGPIDPKTSQKHVENQTKIVKLKRIEKLVLWVFAE